MQTPKRRTYIIDLNGPAARANLRLLALGYPLWGIILPIYFCVLGVHGLTEIPFNWPEQRYILALAYLGLICFTLSILTNRMVITSRTLRFGFKLLSGYKTTDLKKLSLDRSPLRERETLLRFGFSEDNRKVEVIDTQDMEGRMKARLMAAIENLAPQCQTPKAVRSLLTQAIPIKSLQKSNDCTILPYRSRLLMVQVREMVALYQQYFWRVWAALFALATIVIAPFIAIMSWTEINQLLFHKQLAVDDAVSVFVQWWTNAIGTIFPVLSVPLSSTFSIVQWSKLTPITCGLGVVAASSMLILGLYMCRPNRIKLDTKGLTLSLEYYGLTLQHESLAWGQLVAVNLIRQGESNPAAWKIELRAQDPRQTMQLVLGALGGNAQRLALVKAIEQYAPSAEVNPEVLSALAPPEDNSFTELWLSSLASAPQRERLAPLGEGHTLKDGEYVIGTKHGAGGQGVTYLAQGRSSADSRPGVEEEAELVIKETILPVFTDSQLKRQSVEQFERDARLLSRLDHNNIIKLRDYFIEDHRAYLVLDRVHGQNLRQAVEEQGAMSPSVVLDLARQMCEMLIYLHQQDPEIIHRDFTPENLMLDRNGRLKLIDFGVAHEIKSRTTATVVGKHAYLPPEQFRGKPTTQSDLYALAATLYFLLAGCDPEPLSQLIIGQQQAAAFSAAEQQQLIVLGKAIARASELDPADRTQSARQLLQELDPGATIQFNSKEIEITNG